MRFGGLAFAILAHALSACSTTVRSGRPPGDVAADHDEKWHHGFFLGAVEASGPYDLAALCPDGWAELRTETSLLNALVILSNLGIVYAPQSVTIVCAAPPLDEKHEAPAQYRAKSDRFHPPPPEPVALVKAAP